MDLYSNLNYIKVKYPVVGRIMIPKDVDALIPGSCEYLYYMAKGSFHGIKIINIKIGRLNFFIQRGQR